jgi:hypothetical protein
MTVEPSGETAATVTVVFDRSGAGVSRVRKALQNALAHPATHTRDKDDITTSMHRPRPARVSYNPHNYSTLSETTAASDSLTDALSSTAMKGRYSS